MALPACALHLRIDMASDGGARAAMKKRWSLTADTFERLLDALDPDRERAAEAYERLRERIIGLLRWWGATAPEQLADDTLDRVARKLQEGAAISSGSLGAYVRGVARLVFYESTREPLAPLTGREAALASSTDGIDAGDCLDRCLASWGAADRDLILRLLRRRQGVRCPQRNRRRARDFDHRPPYPQLIGCGRGSNAAWPNA